MKSVLMTALNLAAMFTFCFLILGSNAEARVCKKGKPCGNSCISKNDVCHKEATTSTTAPMAQEPESKPMAAPKVEQPATPSAPAQAEKESPKAKHCSKGKSCGNSCIPMDAVCHQ